MKIAVDYQSAAGKKTGIGVAAYNLVEAMQKEARDIRFLLYSSGRPGMNTPRRILWESAEIPLRALKDRPDLVYSPGFAPAFCSPVPQVVTVHDLIGLAWPGNQRAFSGWYWSRWLPAAVRRASCIVASSESTRSDLRKFLNIDEKRVRVVPLGVHPSFRKLDDPARVRAVLEKYGLKEPYMISVSTLEPRKNHLRLLQAYEKLKKAGRAGFSLAIIGKPGGAEQALWRFVKEKDLGSSVHFLGYVEHEELICLYNAAMGYAMISLYEGFGLPVLEAMSCGLSGICSDSSSLPEVAGDTALSVDPGSVDGITRALEAFSQDAPRRAALAQAASQRSKTFSMAQCAQQMIEVFRNEFQK